MTDKKIGCIGHDCEKCAKTKQILQDMDQAHNRLQKRYAELEARLNVPSIDEMVNRFLSWSLPDDFHPDGGIEFNRESAYDHPDTGRHKFKPTGTNLFHAGQAREMIEHILGIKK